MAKQKGIYHEIQDSSTYILDVGITDLRYSRHVVRSIGCDP
jgi:hypothetical protein